MGGIEFASESMTPLRLVGGFPPDPNVLCWEYRKISVNFQCSVEGNNASEGTVDGIGFASENPVCRNHVLCNGFVIRWFVLLLPLTPNFNVGILLWHLRTRFHYTQPQFRPPNRIIPNIEIWGRGETTNHTQRHHVSTCELDSTH